MFFWKMAIYEYLILVFFGQFWLFKAHFWPRTSKVYLFWPFRFDKNNKIKKIGSIWLFGKLGPPGAPKPTLGPKTPLNGPGRAKIGVNAPHVVQLTGFGPKKTNLNRSVPRCVPFTRNQPVGGFTLPCQLPPQSGYSWSMIMNDKRISLKQRKLFRIEFKKQKQGLEMIKDFQLITSGRPTRKCLTLLIARLLFKAQSSFKSCRLQSNRKVPLCR